MVQSATFTLEIQTSFYAVDKTNINQHKTYNYLHKLHRNAG